MAGHGGKSGPGGVRSPGMIGVYLTVGLAVVVAVTYLVTGAAADAGPAVTTGGVVAPPSVTSAPITPSRAAPVPTTSPPAVILSTDPETAALAALEAVRAQDASAAQPDGRSVAQLSSKAVGITDPRLTAANGTHTFYAADILAEHRQLRATGFPDVRIVLVLSTDIGKRQLYEGKPLWLTFGLGSFTGPDDVGVWCARQFPSLTGADLENRCVARRLDPPRV